MAEQVARAYPDALPHDLEAQINALCADIVTAKALTLDVQTYWRGDLARAGAFLAAFEEAARGEGRPVLLEGEGEWCFPVAGEEMVLIGRADRMDRLNDKSIRIIDFKTGEKRPTNKQASTFSPQLLLTALMVEAGAFPPETRGEVSSISFQNMISKRSPFDPFAGHHALSGEALREAMGEAGGALTALLEAYQNPDQGYPSQPRTFFRHDYGDYDHLARRGEWAGRGGDGAADGGGDD